MFKICGNASPYIRTVGKRGILPQTLLFVSGVVTLEVMMPFSSKVSIPHNNIPYF